MSIRRVLGPWVIGLTLTLPVCAQLPNPALDIVFPPGAELGTTVDVDVAGRDLDEAARLVFSPTGLVAERVTRDAQEFENGPQYVPNRFRVVVPPNMPLGVYDVRVVGRFGASTPSSFVIGDVPEHVEAGDNHQPGQAIELPLDHVVNGRTDGGVVDYYRIHAEAGQNLVVECVAQQIDSLLRPVVTVWDAQGKQLARNRHLVEPIVELKVETSGDYLVGVNDHVFAGGATHAYRLRVYAGPYLMAVSPSTAQPGVMQTFSLLGRNLPVGDGGPTMSTIEFEHRALQSSRINLLVPTRRMAAELGRAVVSPVAALSDGILVRVPGQPTSNGIFVPFGEQPTIEEHEANSQPIAAQLVSLPVEVAGSFYPRRDQDWYAFEAKAGESFQLRVISHRLGHPTDPEIFVQKVVKAADGSDQTSQVSTNDDFRATRDRFRLPLRRGLELAHRDPSVRFTADQDAVYRVGLRDLNGSSIDDPRLTYRLIIEPAKGDYELLAWGQHQGADDDKKIDRGALVLRTAGSLPVMIDVLRRGGFEGPIRVTAEDLPAGVSASACVVTAGEIEGTLVLTSTAEASEFVGPIQIVGEALLSGEVVRREAREVTLLSATGNIEQARPRARLARQLMLSVIRTDKSPASVTVATTDATAPLRSSSDTAIVSAMRSKDLDAKVWQTSVGGKLAIPVHLERSGSAEFKGDLALNAFGLPDKCKVQAATIKPDGQDAAVELTLDAADIRPGLYTVFLRGATKLGYARNAPALAAAQQRRTEFESVLQGLATDVQTATTQVEQAKSAIATRAESIAKLESARTTIDQRLVAATEQLKGLAEPLSLLASANGDGANAVTPELNDSIQQATTALQQANDALLAMRNGLNAVQAKMETVQVDMKDATAAVATAEAAHTQATQKQTRAQEFVKQLDAQLAEAQKTLGPLDINAFVDSDAFYVEILPTPIQLQSGTATVQVKRGETLELPLSLVRRFGFADGVTVTPELPSGLQNVQADAVTLAADANAGTLKIVVGEAAPAGTHQLTLRSNLKFNGVDLVDKVPLTVNIQ